MATKTQIGAVIGVEGATQYMNTMKELARQTRVFKGDMDALTTSFDKNMKTIGEAQKQRNLLQKLIDNENKKLAEQKKVMEGIDDAVMNNEISTDKWVTAHKEMQIEIDKTVSNLNKYNQQLNDLPADNFVGKLNLIKENLANNESKLKEWGEAIEKAGQKLTTSLTLPIVAGFGASVTAATNWESAMNGVRKTTDMNEDEMSALGTSIKSMALETTYSSTELANLAQIAGQLGVRGTEGITKFIGVVSDLGISTDLSAEDAATALARIFNITEGGNLDNLEKIGSVIVHLGNNMATTEPEIVAMANRMASAGHTAGLTTKDIFALSSALTSVGITAEAGGSTVGQALTKIEKAFAEWTVSGEGDMLRIAEISNMSAEEFANAWKNEPIKAFEAFVTGLGNLDDESENVTLILDELGMAGIRESNMLKALAAAQDEGTDTTQLFSKALELADEAYKGINADGEEFNALQKEANVRKEESATKFSNLKEAVFQLGQAFGELLLPSVVSFVESITNFLTQLSQMDDGTKTFIITMLGLVAAIGPVLTAVGQLMQFWSNLSIVSKTLDLTNGALLLSIGKWVAIAAGVVVAILAIIKAIQWLRDHSEELKKFWEGAKEGFLLIGEAIKFAVEEGVKWIVDKFNEFKTNVENTSNAIDTWFRNLLTKLKDFFRTKFEEIKTNISNVFNNVKSFLSTTWENITSSISNKVETIKNKITNAFNTAKENAVNAFNNMKSSIAGVISNIVSSAWSWGSDIVHGIANGIRSAIGAVTSAVSNIASTIWSYLHFSEPEKGLLSNFHTWMPDFMQGLAKGINDNIYLVDRAAENVANSLGMGGTGTAYNYGGVVINLNVPQGANGYQIVDEIESALAQKTVRRKAVFA